ncbi:ANTAR domain-containing protein [Streptomyces sp. NPDC087300]|uniref:ANTAR domain-containing protein n=1 Tax=Streptomyces sp. NPDC087300 TaxID=3365780 RepID=UPI0038295DFA
MALAAHDLTMAPALVALANAPARGENDEQILRRLAAAAARIPGVDAAGCSITDDTGRPVLLAASNDIAGELEEVQRELVEGPGLDSRRIRKVLANVEMDHPHSRLRWPHFAPRVLQAGFPVLTTLPLNHHDRAIGSLNLYYRQGTLPREHLRWSELFADATATGLGHRDALRQAGVREEQLQNALDSRVLIEQAKGVLAERLDCTVGDAFDLLRHHARRNRLKLVQVAAEVVNNPATGGPFPRPER